MAEKLSIQIALEGAEEIKRQLADVGKAGQQAFADINKAAAEVGGFNKLDVGAVTAQLEKAGVAGGDVANVLKAVNQAGRMETLVNGIAAVEKGLVKVQAAASSMDQVLLTGLTRSIGMIARLLPAAFGAATVGSIVSTTKALTDLDATAIKLGVSFQDLAGAEAIFKAIGLSFKDARSAASGFFAEQGKIELAGVKEAIANIDEFGRQLKVGANWIKILEDGARSADPVVADLAKNKLAEIGRTVPGISAAAKEIEKIQQSALGAPEKILAIIGVLERMGQTAERTQIANRLFGPEFTQALNAGGVSLELIKQKLLATVPPSQAAADAATRVALEWQKLKNLFASGFTVSVEGLNQVAATLAQIRTAMEAIAATDVFGGMMNMAANTAREIQTIINLLASIGEIGFNAFKNIEAGAVAVWQTIIGWINTAIDAVKKFFSMGGGQASGAGAQGMARGGVMGGRGSGTSDSNLAWLSRGEHVMPAYAVRQPGVLQLLEALRRSGGNLRSVLDRMGHFAMGGMVGPAAMPAFAGGGGAAAHRDLGTVRLVMPSGVMVSGLADAKIVEALHRAAAQAQVRSGGRKPSRYS